MPKKRPKIEGQTDAPDSRKPRVDFRFLGLSLAWFVIGVAGDRLGTDMPKAWRSDGGLFDFWSHNNNVSDTLAFTAAYGICATLPRFQLYHAMTLRKTIAVAAIAWAGGVGTNTVIETPAVYNSTVLRELFPQTPDPIDGAYGDLAATFVAGSWVALRSRQQTSHPALPAQELPDIAELPAPPPMSPYELADEQ